MACVRPYTPSLALWKTTDCCPWKMSLTCHLLTTSFSCTLLIRLLCRQVYFPSRWLQTGLSSGMWEEMTWASSKHKFSIIASCFSFPSFLPVLFCSPLKLLTFIMRTACFRACAYNILHGDPKGIPCMQGNMLHVGQMQWWAWEQGSGWTFTTQTLHLRGNGLL